MTPQSLLQLLHDDLEPWAKARRAEVSLAADAYDVMEILYNRPGAMRIILHWGGDDAQGSTGQEGVVTHRIDVVVARPHGLPQEKGDMLVKSTHGAAPMLTMLEDVRQHLRGLPLPADFSNEGFLDYRGTEPLVTPEGVPLAAYRLKFALWAALDAPYDR